MLVNKTIRILWLFVSLVAVMLLMTITHKMLLFAGYAVLSLTLFFYDYMKSQRIINMPKKKKRWLQYMNVTQVLFWIGLIGMIFAFDLGIFYELFVIMDLFILATFATVKFQNT